MLICIPTNGNAGTEDTICEHFGSAPYFCIYNGESGEAEVVANPNAHHSHGTCQPLSQLAGHNIEAIVCGGMGMRALQALNSAGIKVFRSGGGSVQDVIEQFKAGSLSEILPGQACPGHGHSHGPDQVELRVLDSAHHHGGRGCCGSKDGHSHDDSCKEGHGQGGND